MHRRKRLPGPICVVGPGDEFTLDGTFSYDPEGELLSYEWVISDHANGSSEARPTLSLADPGQYTATLTVSDGTGTINQTDVDQVVIAVNHAPVAEAGDDAHTETLTVVFDGSASGDADGDRLTYRWDFGDGNTANGIRVVHAFETGGFYPVILTVDDGTGLHNASDRDAVNIRINRSPVALAGESRRACTNDVVLFDASGSTDADGNVLTYEWDFGDGTASTLVNPTKEFDGAGVYQVSLTVDDGAGLANSRHSDRLVVRIDQAPEADAGPDIIACVNTDIQFDGTRSTDLDGVVNAFSWDFGEGTGGAGDRPLHSFSEPGSYDVRLSVEGDQIGQCSSTASDDVRVTVVEAPLASITAPAAAPVGADVTFDGIVSASDTGNITAWHWSFGDGAQASGEQVAHAFAEPGTYRVSLLLDNETDIETCRVVQAYHLITVNASPKAVAGDDRVSLVDEEILFDASQSRDADGGIVEYVWDFGDGATAEGLQVRHVYRAPGTYDVMLRVKDDTDLENSVSEDTMQVTVADPSGPAIDGPRVACAGDTVFWRLLDADDSGIQYTWLLGDGVAADGPAVSPPLRPHRAIQRHPVCRRHLRTPRRAASRHAQPARQ